MMSVSESSTALIVPYGTTSAPGSIHSVRSSGSGCSSRAASTTMSAPRTTDSQSSHDAHGTPEVALELRAERLAALGPARVDADLVELEQVGEQAHVPVGGAARADVAEHARVRAREVARAERGDGARAHVGEPGGVDHGLRHARARVVQRQQAVLRRQPALVVVDVVADDLDAREPERRDVAAQHVEVPAERLVGPQVHARLDHGLAQALGAQAALDRVRGSRRPSSASASTSGRLRYVRCSSSAIPGVCPRENRERRRSGASLDLERKKTRATGARGVAGSRSRLVTESSAPEMEPERKAERDEDADRNDREHDCILGHRLAAVALGEQRRAW